MDNMNNSVYATDIFQYDGWELNTGLRSNQMSLDDAKALVKLMNVRQYVIVGLGNPISLESRETVTGFDDDGHFITRVVTRDHKGNRRQYCWHEEDFIFYETEGSCMIEARHLRML